jgi:hypothetical protein
MARLETGRFIADTGMEESFIRPGCGGKRIRRSEAEEIVRLLSIKSPVNRSPCEASYRWPLAKGADGRDRNLPETHSAGVLELRQREVFGGLCVRPAAGSRTRIGCGAGLNGRKCALRTSAEEPERKLENVVKRCLINGELRQPDGDTGV